MNINSKINDDMNMSDDRSMERGDYFDSFAMASRYHNSRQNSRMNALGIKDPTTSTRNKVGFFKKSLILVKDDDAEIAFKRSSMNSAMDELRVIFYINNKTLYQQQVDIQYRDDGNNYDITVK